MKRKKGFYSISVVAKMFSVHQQTIRLYEKEGLIAPLRSAGNTRLFSEEDLDKLEQVIHLTHKVGVNIAGVEIILKQQKKLKRLQDEMNKLFNVTQEQMEKENEEFSTEIKKNSTELLQIKEKNSGLTIKQKSNSTRSSKNDTPQSDINLADEWKIDYDE